MVEEARMDDSGAAIIWLVVFVVGAFLFVRRRRTRSRHGPGRVGYRLRLAERGEAKCSRRKSSSRTVRALATRRDRDGLTCRSSSTRPKEDRTY